MKHDQEITIDVPNTLTLDNNQLMVESAADGLGIAYVPELYAIPLLKTGRLVAVLEDWCLFIPRLFLYFPHNRRSPPATKETSYHG